MSLIKILRWRVTLLLLGAAALFLPQQALAAARTFASLTISPASTNITAGASFTANVALGTKASSGSTASGAVVIYVGSISPADPHITTSLNPAAYTIATSATNNSLLTITT